jgi:N6-L-threonylcarbamoyladenine synthase
VIIAGLEGTAWNLGICIYDTNSKKYLHNSQYPLIGQNLDPKIVYTWHLQNLHNILSLIKEFSPEILFYSKGPGFPKNFKILKFIVNYAQIFTNSKIMGVNHGLAHLVYCSYLNNIEFKGIGLYLSGGNSQIIEIKDNFEINIIGQTLDIAVGNAIDKLGRRLGIKHPCGPKIENLANNTIRYTHLKTSIKGTNFILSGLVNSAYKLLGVNNINFVSRSFMLSCFSCIIECLERAIYLTNTHTVICSGGVLQNKILKGLLYKLSENTNSKVYTINGKENSDNPKMICITGYILYKKGFKLDQNCEFFPNLRIYEN